VALCGIHRTNFKYPQVTRGIYPKLGILSFYFFAITGEMPISVVIRLVQGYTNYGPRANAARKAISSGPRSRDQ